MKEQESDSSLSELDSLSDSPVSEPVWPRKMSEPPQSELSPRTSLSSERL